MATNFRILKNWWMGKIGLNRKAVWGFALKLKDSSCKMCCKILPLSSWATDKLKINDFPKFTDWSNDCRPIQNTIHSTLPRNRLSVIQPSCAKDQHKNDNFPDSTFRYLDPTQLFRISGSNKPPKAHLQYAGYR